jgi:hypothetical protein
MNVAPRMWWIAWEIEVGIQGEIRIKVRQEVTRK